MQLHILSSTDINQALSMNQAIGVIRQAFLSLAQQKVIMPPRNIINIVTPPTVQEGEKLAVFMPAYFADTGALGIKIASLVATNHLCGLPLIHAIVILLDVSTGMPLALLEGAAITALKTGATSGLATEILAPKKTTTLAMIGAGAQARAQLKAMCCVRKFQQIKIYSRTQVKAQQFATEILQQGNISSEVIVCDTLREATQNADIICTTTTSKTPIIDIADVKPGVHINAIGSHTLTTREISAPLIAKAKVVVEQRAATFRESCEREVIELGELITHSPKSTCLQSPVTLFASVGTALQDIAIATAVWKLAKEKNLGVFINL